MMQKHRIRTEIGQDQKLTVEIKQDYDLLEILSLKFTQQDIYTSLCADYGVVAGRISVNDGFGVANARVSIFIPLSDEDSNDPIISALYPYTSPSETNDDGYRYNLLPSRKQHTGHTPTGTFPDQEDILGREEVLEVYEKYYKYTVKTNDSGDFMIWGVPVGQQTIHVDVDMSDMGCQSLVPYDFVYEGVSEQKFENGYTFMSSNNIAGLPQITTFEKTIEIYPFWGNEDLCEIGITRTDFDLKEQGIRIEPYSIMMGGSFTDGGKDSVRVKCNVDNQMGEKCALITTKGDVEGIRFTGEYDKNVDGTLNYRRPKLEAVELDTEIDDDGNFFFRVPMNMRYVITNEFGETVTTKDRNKGIATRATYRFRFSLQNDNGAKKQYRGKYLVPQIKEHQTGSQPFNQPDPKSYAFSTDIDDYHDDAIDDISGEGNSERFANDYFYSFRYNRVYTPSSFINQYHNKGWWEKAFNFLVKDKNESFIGIKEIQPSIEEDCSNSNQYFPINDAVSNFKFKFLIIIILNWFEKTYLLITQFLIDNVIEVIFDISDAINKWPLKTASKKVAGFARNLQKSTIRSLGLINYPDCYECNDDGNEGSSNTGGTTQNYVVVTSGDEEDYALLSGTTILQTNVTGTHNFDVNQTLGDPDESLYITISGTNQSIRNYIIKFQTVGEQGYTDSNGNWVVTTQADYGYLFVGFGSGYAEDLEFTSPNFGGIMSEIYEAVLFANNQQSAPYPLTILGTALTNSGQVIINTVYLVSELTETIDPAVEVESGCEKYDVIYDAGNDMNLKAWTGTTDYSTLIQNPDSFGPYPTDIFQDDSECVDATPSNVNVSISAYVPENSNWDDLRGRRCVLKKFSPKGTASGYSEFQDGYYTLVGDAGKNAELIKDYSQRKLLGKLMCAGITSYTFSNSWLNGSLYFFQFRRRRGGSSAKYCKDLIFRKSDDNGAHYYYRSTPYMNNNFIGLSTSLYDKEILFPTTIMDLGPRNMFIKEICVDPELDVNCAVSKSIGATSYQDINNLMEYVIQSKEIKERGKLQAKDLFDKRGGGKLDGDIAQLLNFNSQMGIFGYEDEDDESPYYPPGGAFIYDGYGPVGVDFVFSEDDEDTAIIEKDGTLMRLCINSAGNLTETAQDIPFYKWNKRGDGFGGNGATSESQDWVRSTIYTTKYQGGWTSPTLMETDPYGGAGGNPEDNINSHYFDGSILPPIRDCGDDNYAESIIPIGGPFFFYFGLRTGKTAWNKFVEKFGPL